MSRLRVIARVGLVACLLCLAWMRPSTGFAQDDTSDEAMAEKHFEAGAELFYEAEYSRAIVEFRKAYRYQPDPMILFNVAAAHLRLENYEDARRFAQRADEDGGLPDKIIWRNRAVIAALTVRLRAESVAGDVHDERRALAGVGDPGPEPRSTDGSELGTLGWTGVGLLGVGVGLTAYATYVEVSLRDDIDAYKRAAEQDPDEHARLREDIDARQSRGRIALYSGIGLGGLGVGLWLTDLLGTNEQDSPTVAVTPGLGSGRVDVVVPF
ncbi:MAG: tetratricopeptide repeat protein [Persicimonas sp.]